VTWRGNGSPIPWRGDSTVYATVQSMGAVSLSNATYLYHRAAAHAAPSNSPRHIDNAVEKISYRGEQP